MLRCCYAMTSRSVECIQVLSISRFPCPVQSVWWPGMAACVWSVPLSQEAPSSGQGLMGSRFIQLLSPARWRPPVARGGMGRGCWWWRGRGRRTGDTTSALPPFRTAQLHKLAMWSLEVSGTPNSQFPHPLPPTLPLSNSVKKPEKLLPPVFLHRPPNSSGRT